MIDQIKTIKEALLTFLLVIITNATLLKDDCKYIQKYFRIILQRQVSVRLMNQSNTFEFLFLFLTKDVQNIIIIFAAPENLK